MMYGVYLNMLKKHSINAPAVPFFGTYTAPGGSVQYLTRPSDVYDLFRALLARMPKHAEFHDATNPGLGRFRRIGPELVKQP